MAEKPRSELTAEQAVESLNFFDLTAIKKHWNVTLAEAEAKADVFAFALVWAIEKRGNADLTVKDIQGMSMGEINAYFTPEEEQDPFSEPN